MSFRSELRDQYLASEVRLAVGELWAGALGLTWEVAPSEPRSSGSSDVNAFHLLECRVRIARFLGGLSERQLLGVPVVQNLLVVVRNRLQHEDKTLSKMMKPSISAYDDFKRLFDKYSKKAGKQQYLIPYFIAAHPGCDEEDMLNLSVWLKQHNFKPDQVQTFYPSPMALATAMYYSERNPLAKVRYKSEKVSVCKDIDQRRLQKAFLRYHDEKNWPMLRQALHRLGRSDLIGTGEKHLIPPQSQTKKVWKRRHKSG